MADLISLSDVREALRLESNQTADDTFITKLKTRIEDTVEGYCNRVFSAATYTEYYDGDGTQYLFLKHFPINSTAGDIDLWDDLDRKFTDSDNNKINKADILIYSNEGIISLWNEETVFNTGNQNIKVTYNAGYRTIDERLKDQLISMTIRRYRQYTNKELGVSSKSNPDGSVTYNLDIFLTRHEKSVLDFYKKHGFKR